jgi:hypothetical protein
MENLIITPKTKIYDLLETYPQLEEVLITMAPQFRKLKNPVLRKTITRITNLSQAATIAGLEIDVLVNKLRIAAGQSELTSFGTAAGAYVSQCPSWYSVDGVTETIDIREMLNAGEQPVHAVLASLKKLDDGKILKIIAPFIPAPLLDKSLSLNYRHWLDKKSDSEYFVYFTR